MLEEDLESEIIVSAQELHFSNTLLTICHFGIAEFIEVFQSCIYARDVEIKLNPEVVCPFVIDCVAVIYFPLVSQSTVACASSSLVSVATAHTAE